MQDLIDRISFLECQVAFLQNNIMERLTKLERNSSNITNPQTEEKVQSMYDEEFYVSAKSFGTPRFVWSNDFSRFPIDCNINEIDKYGNNILCHSNNIKLTNLAIEKGVDVNHRNLTGLTPLHFAYRNPNVINLLIIAGANVNGRNNDGKTPIFLAVKKLPVLKTLVSYGANINIKDCKGKSVGDLTKNVDILEYLKTLDS